MRYVLILTTLIISANCSRMATIHKKDGTVVEAMVVSSDASMIYLAGHEPVSRDSVRDIDHPGDVHAIIGTFLAVLGSASGIAMVFTMGEYGGYGAAPILGVGVPGAIVAIWGWYTWATSRSSAAPPEKPAGPKVTPVALTDGERTYYGLGLCWRW